MKNNILFTVVLLLGCLGLRAQSNSDGSYSIPVYETNPGVFGPSYYTIYVGISGVDNGQLLPYLFDSGSPNFFSTAGSDGDSNATTNGYFNFSGNGSPGYYYQTLTNTISLGSSNQTTIATSSNNVAWAQIRAVSNTLSDQPPVFFYPSNNALVDGTYGNFGAGLYGNSTLATVLPQIPLAAGLKLGYSIDFTTNLTASGTGSLTLGLSTSFLETLSNMPGAIVLPLSPSGSNLPTANGTTPGYQRAQVSNVAVSLTKDGVTTNLSMPFVLDTGGGTNQIIYDTDTNLYSYDKATNLTVSTSNQTIYNILGGRTPWGGGVDVDTNNTNGLRINSGGYFFESNIVTFDLADGVVIIDPVPEPSTCCLFGLAGALALVMVWRRKNA